jgi:hypothetical protein
MKTYVNLHEMNQCKLVHAVKFGLKLILVKCVTNTNVIKSFHLERSEDTVKQLWNATETTVLFSI